MNKASAPNLALFDLDHTLLPIDSDHTWGAFCIAEGLVDPIEHKARNEAFSSDYFRHPRLRHVCDAGGRKRKSRAGC
jgi:phosphoserine phosphatase